jgi:hypothetical protein
MPRDRRVPELEKQKKSEVALALWSIEELRLLIREIETELRKRTPEH